MFFTLFDFPPPMLNRESLKSNQHNIEREMSEMLDTLEHECYPYKISLDSVSAV